MLTIACWGQSQSRTGHRIALSGVELRMFQRPLGNGANSEVRPITAPMQFSVYITLNDEQYASYILCTILI